jgi:hypothetical protein
MPRSIDIRGYLVWTSYEVASYVVPFQAKTAQFYDSDSRYARTVPVACVRIKVVGLHFSMLRSTNIEEFLIWISYECQVTLSHFKANRRDSAVWFHGMSESCQSLGSG